MEKLLDRELDTEEKERLQRIQDTLQIADNDALWAVISAMEYQRAYYETLPEKISSVTEKILAEWAEAARKNAAAPQKAKGKKAGEQANVISLKELVQPWCTALLTLCLLLLYGSLAMWAGYSIGSGHTQPPGLLMRMPVGILMGLLCMSVCVMEGIRAAKAFADTDSSWRKHALAAGALLVPGAWSVSVAVF